MDLPSGRLHRNEIRNGKTETAFPGVFQEWSASRRPGSAELVWQDAQPVVRTRIYAPHLERLARTWVRDFASQDTVGGVANEVESSELSGVGQLDLVAVERNPSGASKIIAIGEVKSGVQPVGLAEVARLDEAVKNLASVRSVRVRRMVTPSCKRILVSRAGFTAELHKIAAGRPDVELVDLPRLYGGL